MKNRTPQVYTEGQWRRVRIPVEGVEQLDAERVFIAPGFYPLVENGHEVTADTHFLYLMGNYKWERSDCGLGCRCNARITSTSNSGLWCEGVMLPQPGR